MSASWFYAQGGQRQGPFTVEAMQALAAQGRIQPSDLVWNPTMPNWAPAQSVGQLWAAGPVAVAGPVQVDYVSPSVGGAVPAATTDALRQTQGWVRFVGVLLLVLGGLAGLFLLGVVVLGMSFLGRKMGSLERGALGFFVMIWLAMLVVMVVIPGVYLNRYATNIGRLAAMGRMVELEQALDVQRGFWKYSGIVMIVFLCFCALAILFALASIGSVP